MQIVNLTDLGKNYKHEWPDRSVENYSSYVTYKTLSEKGQHDVMVTFGKRHVYGKNRVRVLVIIDKHVHAEFLGADDFNKSGDVLSEIKVPGDKGERICRYPEEPVPERYTMFNTIGLPIRVKAKRTHNSWAVVSNIADHKTR